MPFLKVRTKKDWTTSVKKNVVGEGTYTFLGSSRAQVEGRKSAEKENAQHHHQQELNVNS